MSKNLTRQVKKGRHHHPREEVFKFDTHKFHITHEFTGHHDRPSVQDHGRYTTGQANITKRDLLDHYKEFKWLRQAIPEWNARFVVECFLSPVRKEHDSILGERVPNNKWDPHRYTFYGLSDKPDAAYTVLGYQSAAPVRHLNNVAVLGIMKGTKIADINVVEILSIKPREYLNKLTRKLI